MAYPKDPGNYPRSLVEALKNGQNPPLRTRTSFLVIIIDGSDSSKVPSTQTDMFFQEYYTKIRDFINENDYIDLIVNKFVGDGVLILCEKSSDSQIQRLIDALYTFRKRCSLYLRQYRVGVYIVITRVRNVTYARLGNPDTYLDFSIWGRELNQVFKVHKEFGRGKILVGSRLAKKIPPKFKLITIKKATQFGYLEPNPRSPSKVTT